MKPALLIILALLAGCAPQDRRSVYADSPEAAKQPIARVDTFNVMPVPPFIAPDPVTGQPTPYVATNNGVFNTNLTATPFNPVGGAQ